MQSEIVGVITELYVKEGDSVKQRDLLLKIDPVQTESETRAQQALLEAALAEATNQKAPISLQETNVNGMARMVMAVVKGGRAGHLVLQLRQSPIFIRTSRDCNRCSLPSHAHHRRRAYSVLA